MRVLLKLPNYQGELGFEQKLYVDSGIALILAIKAKNTTLIAYYFNLITIHNPTIFLIYAIKTADISIVKQVLNSCTDDYMGEVRLHISKRV